MNKKNQPRIPSIGDFVRNYGVLIDIVQVSELPKPPPQPVTDFIFEETEARTEMRLNGEVINEMNTYNDFYGRGTSVKSLTKEANEYCAEKGIAAKSDIELVVVKITRRYRAKQVDRENIYDDKFFDFEPLPFGTKRSAMPDPVEEVVWSSKKNLRQEEKDVE